jgi:hypothetical protein
MPVAIGNKLILANEVWIAAALLHRENPSLSDFSVDEIVGRAAKEKLTPVIRPGVYVYAQMHCVANRPPNPARYRMLLETSSGRRRLFRPGDPYDPKREGSKTVPDANEIPEKYLHLLTWYADWIKSPSVRKGRFDALLALQGSANGLYGNPDDYVRKLREGWE